MHSAQQPSRSRYIVYLILGWAALFYCYEFFLRVAPSVMSHHLMSTFHINATLLGTLSAFYFYAYTPLQLVVGVIVDVFDTLKVLLFAMIACVIGTALFAYTDGFTVAAIGRFLQGFGSAFAFIGLLKIAATHIKAERFATFSGLASSLGYLGGGLGEIFINHYNQSMGWRPTMKIFIYIGIALVIGFYLTALCQPKDKRDSKPFYLSQAGRGLMETIKNKKIWLIGAIACCMYLPVSVFASMWGIPYMEKLHHFSSTRATDAVAFIFIGWAIGTIAAGFYSDRIKNRIKLIRYCTLLACLIALVLLYNPSLSYPSLCLLFLAFGVVSSTETLTFVMAKDLSFSDNTTGMSMAFINMLSMLGGMLFQRGIGEILDHGWQGFLLHGIRVYPLLTYQKAVAVVPIALIIGFIISFFIKDSFQQSLSK